MKSNGVIANALAAAELLATNQKEGAPAIDTFLSPVGNALSLLAHEWALLRSIDAIIHSCNGRVSEAAAIPVYVALVCRHSQLIDHACYRALAGRKSRRLLSFIR